ncbi:MAG TPA: MFS transporter [Pseudonocardiaceae bacterium]|nr:MFS transporter [Pseudonocardiaceae bacterium]
MATDQRPLRRNRRFQYLWLGSTIGYLGIETADIAYPLAVLALTGSPAAAGLFGVVQLLATLVVGLPAGVLVDRYDRRRVLLLSEGIRALAAASVAAALAEHRLGVAQLLVVGAVLGACGPFTSTARTLLVRAVVPDEQLTSALTTEQIRDGMTQLVGPPLGGLLYGLRQPLPFGVGAIAFAVSWLTVLKVRVPRHRPAAPDGAAGGALAGLRTIWRNPTLRTATLLVAVLNTVGAPVVLITTVLLRQQHVSPSLIGVAVAGYAIGGLIGAALVKPLHRRFQPGHLLIGVALFEAPLLFGLGIRLGPWWVAALLLCAGLGIPALQVLVDVLIFRQVPDEQRGRVISATITLIGIGMPIGAGLAGLLLQYLAAPVAMAVLACTLAGACGYAATRRHLRSARWPDSSAADVKTAEPAPTTA